MTRSSERVGLRNTIYSAFYLCCQRVQYSNKYVRMLECVGHDPGVLGSDLVNICIIKTKIGVANISLQCRTQYWLHSTGSVNYHLWWCHVKCFVCFSSDSFLNERRNGKYYWQLWELTRREENIIANISLIIARLHQDFVICRYLLFVPSESFNISTKENGAYLCNAESNYIPNILFLMKSEKK